MEQTEDGVWLTCEEYADLISVQLVVVKHEDVVVVLAQRRLPSQSVEKLKATVRDIFPGHSVAVLDDGVRLAFARMTEKPSDAETQIVDATYG